MCLASFSQNNEWFETYLCCYLLLSTILIHEQSTVFKTVHNFWWTYELRVFAVMNKAPVIIPKELCFVFRQKFPITSDLNDILLARECCTSWHLQQVACALMNSQLFLNGCTHFSRLISISAKAQLHLFSSTLCQYTDDSTYIVQLNK